MRGAVSQIVGVAGIFFGFLIACHYYEQVSLLVIRYLPGFTGAVPVTFILLFLLTWFSIGVAGFWIVRLIRGVGLGFLDRLWGGMIGFGKALFFAIAIVSILTLFSAGTNPTLLTQSALVPRIRAASDFLLKIAPGTVQSEYSKRRKDLEKFLTKETALLMEGFTAPGRTPKDKSDRK